MSQSQYHQTIYMQPNKHTSSKCHNHNIIKQFICSQIKHDQLMSQSQYHKTIYMQPNQTRPVNVTINHIIKQFICSQTNTRPVNVTINISSNNLYEAKQTHDQ